MTEKLVISYKEYLKNVGKIFLPVSVALTPRNLNEEKRKFFASEKYNPVFSYPGVNVSESHATLKRLSAVSHMEGLPMELWACLRKTIKSKLSTAEIIMSISKDSEFNRLSCKKFKVPSLKYTERAKRVLRGVTKKFNITDADLNSRTFEYSSKEVMNLIRQFLGLLGINVSNEPAFDSGEYNKLLMKGTVPNTWCVMESKFQGASVKVGSKFRTIYVAKDAKFSAFRVKKILIHEIGSHVLRSANGFETGFEFLGKPTVSSYLYTEEGLTAVNEELYGLLTRRVLNRFALMSYNIYLAHERGYSFRQLYNINNTFFPSKEAFSLAYRAKRGLTDTSKPGGYTKDAVYLKGFFLTRYRIDNDPLIYNKLYAGKIPFKWVSLLDSSIINMPKYLMDKDAVSRFINEI
ncbi:DUF1704 domain-containing protein [Candidatus Dojkabacteria bacterium]|nr:DUF1704 domain-containing protein [Candidatus Dojkabacteria bacterium]